MFSDIFDRLPMASGKILLLHRFLLYIAEVKNTDGLAINFHTDLTQ